MDDRPARLLAKADVPEDHRALLLDLVETAGAAAESAGIELQSEFGKHHVALIVGCNQFVRLYRNGEHAGQVEVRPDDAVRTALQEAGFEMRPAVGGQVFAMFGWQSLDPTTGDAESLKASLTLLLEQARQSGAAPSVA